MTIAYFKNKQTSNYCSVLTFIAFTSLVADFAEAVLDLEHAALDLEQAAFDLEQAGFAFASIEAFTALAFMLEGETFTNLLDLVQYSTFEKETLPDFSHTLFFTKETLPDFSHTFFSMLPSKEATFVAVAIVFAQQADLEAVLAH
ncbi:MAG: hypothetical protein ACI8YQ_002527 [Polaribacter sp.]